MTTALTLGSFDLLHYGHNAASLTPDGGSVSRPSDAASRGWFNRRHYRTCIRVGIRLVKVAKAIDVAGQKLIWWGL